MLLKEMLLNILGLFFIVISLATAVKAIPVPLSPLKVYRNTSYSDHAFVLESSGIATSLDYRQACSVESLLYRNPDIEVYLILTGPNVDTESKTMKILSKYPNFRWKKINLEDYFAGTPLENWFSSSGWEKGPYAVAHLSDAMRPVALFKFGGYYFDLDIIHLRPVTVYRNFIVAQDGMSLANGVIHAEYGQPAIKMAMELFANTYRRDLYDYNGPRLMTRVLQETCKKSDVIQMWREGCSGFHVLHPFTFYPIHWKNWEQIFTFQPRDNAAVIEELYKQGTIGVHVWNFLSAKTTVHKNQNQLYVDLARYSCPKIFEEAPETF